MIVPKKSQIKPEASISYAKGKDLANDFVGACARIRTQGEAFPAYIVDCGLALIFKALVTSKEWGYLPEEDKEEAATCFSRLNVILNLLEDLGYDLEEA